MGAPAKISSLLEVGDGMVHVRIAQAVRGYNTSEPPDLGYLLHRCSSPRLVIRDRTEAVSRNGD